MTDNFIVFVEQPFKLDIVKLATAYFRGVNWGSCLKFDKDDIVSLPLSLAVDRTMMFLHVFPFVSSLQLMTIKINPRRKTKPELCGVWKHEKYKKQDIVTCKKGYFSHYWTGRHQNTT